MNKKYFTLIIIQAVKYNKIENIILQLKRNYILKICFIIYVKLLLSRLNDPEKRKSFWVC